MRCGADGSMRHLPQPRARNERGPCNRFAETVRPRPSKDHEVASGVKLEGNDSSREGPRVESSVGDRRAGGCGRPEEGPRALGEGGPLDFEPIRGRVLLYDV